MGRLAPHESDNGREWAALAELNGISAKCQLQVVYIAACAGQMEVHMNARERCRAKRHAIREKERMIAAATGSNYRTSLPASLYAAGHRNTRKEAVHIIK